jgi:serine protease Do
VKYTGQFNMNWRTMAMTLALAGAAFAQTTPPPTPPVAPPAATSTDQQSDSARDAAREADRAKRDVEREADRAKRDADRAKRDSDRATARAREAQNRSRRISITRTYAFGEGSYLGVDVQDVSKDRLPALKLKDERGAEVTMVDQDGPAGKAGLKEGDVILSFNGDKVESAEQLKRMIHETPPGRGVALGVSRGGQSVNLNVQLADRRQLGEMNAPHVMIPPMPPMHIEIPQIEIMSHTSTPRVGISVESLTPQLGDFFGAPNGQGLLVRSVEKGSPADQAGIKAGDVIVKVGGERITDSGDWRMTLRDKTGAVPFTIMRDKREQTLNVKVPERRSANNGTTTFTFDSQEFAANMKDFEKGMKEWQKEWEKNGKEWEKNGKEWQKEFEKSFKFDYDDDSDTPKPIQKPMVKKPSITVTVAEKTGA